MTENRYPVDESAVQEQADWVAGRGGSVVSQVGRRMSERTSRRSLISKLGRWTLGVSGVAVISSLPVTRAAEALADDSAASALPSPKKDPYVLTYDNTKDASKCEYWRWCNMDGTPCTSCVGGGLTTCAPGSKPGAEFWVGCCTNPDDGKSYLVAYYDCCGAPGCSTTHCSDPENEAVMYNPVAGSYDQDIIWCVSNESQAYACSMAPIIGEDCQVRPSARPKVGAGS